RITLGLSGGRGIRLGPLRFLVFLTIIGSLVAGCEPGSGRRADRPERESSNVGRTLKIMLRNEVDSLAVKVSGPNAPERTRRMFNAELALYNAGGAVLPYLAE